MAEDERTTPTSVGAWVWLFVRWIPAVLMVSLLTAWALVAMGGLARVIGWIFLLFAAPAAGFWVSVAVGIYALVRRRVSQPMVVTWALAVPVMIPGLFEHGILAVPYPASPEDSTTLVRLPTRREMRVYWGGSTLSANYHALYPDQRFAYDLVVEPAGLGVPELDRYGCYGVEVIAPAGGTVVIAHDGELDQPAGAVADVAQHFGNHVVLALADDAYLVLAHLGKDSVSVKAGDVVAQGAVLGRCGNSGRSSEPHVHLHLQRQDPRTHSSGLAEGRPLGFRDLADGPALPSGGAKEESGRITLSGDRLRPLDAP